MIFETLYESAAKGELILLAGGYCRWHKRRDGVITIYEIISTRPGAGAEMLDMLCAHTLPIVAKCPARLEANAWYAKKGFALVRTETTRGGTELNIWRLG